jgi:diaminohydroxyphosphoribosylaminopyrimidine deaminase/5-amino-6-(5-phosphoribosylamino)uracil reductase
MNREDLMRLAIAEARKASGSTHPNPAVGAVICHNGEVVARGHTQPAGSDHAEIVALKEFHALGLDADESTILAVTLEPCSTEGSTGACTDAIRASGIRRLVAGATDPNPDHKGRGFEVLRSAGIAVETGVLEGECTDLNLIFNWHMEKQMPLFAGKVATTIDGRIATRGGASKWITGPEARADVHLWRRYFPAIAVGAGTVIADDPALTARLEGLSEWCPVRFVFDRHLITFKDGLHRVYSDKWKERTIVVTNDTHGERTRQLAEAQGLHFWELDAGGEDAGLSGFAGRCMAAGIHGVYIEGGANLLSSFLRHQFLHYIFAYRAPRILADTSALSPFMGQEPASMRDSVHLRDVRHGAFGDDQLMRGFVVYPDN